MFLTFFKLLLIEFQYHIIKYGTRDRKINHISTNVSTHESDEKLFKCTLIV